MWSSSDPSVAEVDENGNVHALKGGTAVITAASTDPEYKSTARCTVTVGQAVQSISFSSAPKRVQKSTYGRLTITMTPANPLNSAVTWKSSNEKVLKVDNNGNYSAVGVGKATVTCTAADGSGVKASTEITVYQPVTSISPKQWQYILLPGKSMSTGVNVTPSDASDRSVTYKSDSKCVTIDSSTGKITWNSAGTAKITVTANDGSGKTATFNVVCEPTVPVKLTGMSKLNNGYALQWEFKNNCSMSLVTDVYFDVTLKTYDGSTISSGSYHSGNYCSIEPGKTSLYSARMSGAAYAYKIVVTVTGVKYSDGTSYYIPSSSQETTTWTW